MGTGRGSLQFFCFVMDGSRDVGSQQVQEENIRMQTSQVDPMYREGVSATLGSPECEMLPLGPRPGLRDHWGRLQWWAPGGEPTTAHCGYLFTRRQMAQDGHWERQGHKEAEEETAMARGQLITGREGGTWPRGFRTKRSDLTSGGLTHPPSTLPSAMTPEGKEANLLGEGLRVPGLSH